MGLIHEYIPTYVATEYRIALGIGLDAVMEVEGEVEVSRVMAERSRKGTNRRPETPITNQEDISGASEAGNYNTHFFFFGCSWNHARERERERAERIFFLFPRYRYRYRSTKRRCISAVSCRANLEAPLTVLGYDLAVLVGYTAAPHIPHPPPLPLLAPYAATGLNGWGIFLGEIPATRDTGIVGGLDVG